ncbi:MAG TPA: hypothetical protein DCS82_12845 [Rhodospirillaceae bacterium]|nr:hypothetical protein [Rhodospirillaceae bacterium]
MNMLNIRRLKLLLAGRSRKRLLRFALPIAVLAGAFLIVGILKATKPEVQAKPAQEKQWPVAIIDAKPGDIRPRRRFYGEITAGREAELRAEVQGRVVEINENFIDGGIVSKGDLLVSFDAFDYAAEVSERDAEWIEAKARLAELRADYDGALALLELDKEQSQLRERDVARRAKLMRRKNVSEKTFDDAKLALSEARQRVIERGQTIAKLKANIESQEATIKRRSVALQRAKRDLADTRLYAPFDGFLTGVGTAVGRYVSVGDTVAKLIRAGRLEVKFQVGTRQFGRLARAGDLVEKPVEVVWRGGASETFRAKIARVESVVDAATGGVNLYAKLDGLDRQTRLRPGIFVEVYLSDRTYRNVVRLPETALHEDTVYTVVDGRLQARKVRVETRIGDEVLVTGPLEDGDRIVITGFNEIGPGLRVTVR